MAGDLTVIKAALEDLSDDELERLIAAKSNKPRRSGAYACAGSVSACGAAGGDPANPQEPRKAASTRRRYSVSHLADTPPRPRRASRGSPRSAGSGTA
jgi:hypothetical protein